MTPAHRAAAEQYQAHRVRYLPAQIEATRRKLLHLEREARRLGLNDLLETPTTEAR